MSSEKELELRRGEDEVDEGVEFTGESEGRDRFSGRDIDGIVNGFGRFGRWRDVNDENPMPCKDDTVDGLPSGRGGENSPFPLPCCKLGRPNGLAKLPIPRPRPSIIDMDIDPLPFPFPLVLVAPPPLGGKQKSSAMFTPRLIPTPIPMPMPKRKLSWFTLGNAVGFGLKFVSDEDAEGLGEDGLESSEGLEEREGDPESELEEDESERVEGKRKPPLERKLSFSFSTAELELTLVHIRKSSSSALGI